MSKRWYVETTPTGRRQFVLQRSRSHHDHHHHHHHDHDCAHITKDEWKNLVEREHNLRVANEALTSENYALKANYRDADAEARRLQAWIPQLQGQINHLLSENESLRRSIDNAGDHSQKDHRELERLRHKLSKAEKENESLQARIREVIRECEHRMARRCEELSRMVEIWRRKFEASEDRNANLRREVDDQNAVIAGQSERIRALERILRRHGYC